MTTYRYTIHYTGRTGRRHIVVALPRPITGWRDLALVEQQLRHHTGEDTLTVASHSPYPPQPGHISDHGGQQLRRDPSGTRTGRGTAAADRHPAAAPRRGADTNRIRPDNRSRGKTRPNRRLGRIGNRLFLAGLVAALLAGNLLPTLLHVSSNLGGGVVFHVLAPAVFLAAGAWCAVRCHTWSRTWTSSRRYHRRDPDRGTR
jgi:hypothetical protein